VRIFNPEDEMPFAGHPTLGHVQRVAHAGSQPSAYDFAGPEDRQNSSCLSR
jgi:predicted PhzF superfamily epimerase YddE/YHI9